MSKYTTEVRYICENYAGLTKSQDYDKINEVIGIARDKVFDFDFPIFDSSYRSVLETKILKHYYTREIGFETVGMWKHFLDMRLNEIMPYYNQMYKSASLEFNPFYDVDFSTSGNKDEKGNESGKSENTRTDNLNSTTNENGTNENTRTENGESSNQNHSTEVLSDTTHETSRYSDTPQGSLQNIEDNTYLTNATINDGTDNRNTTTDSNGSESHSDTTKDNGSESHTSTTNNTGTVKNDGNNSRDFTTTNEYVEHVIGKRNSNSYSQLLIEYRKTFVNIDMMIIEELGDLFLNLW